VSKPRLPIFGLAPEMADCEIDQEVPCSEEADHKGIGQFVNTRSLNLLSRTGAEDHNLKQV
jgi:hypothetical protein